MYRNEAVKGFELTLETSGKLLKKTLKPFFASPRQVDQLFFKDIFRQGAKHGLLNLDLPEKYLTLLRNLIREHLPETEIWAYGSRVTQQNHEASDLDLVVLHAGDDIMRVLNFRQALRESNLPVLVDVMDWQQIPPSFRDEINKKHVVIYPQALLKGGQVDL